MTTTTLSYKIEHKKVRLFSISQIKINWKLFYLLGILFLASLLVSYVFLVIQLTDGSHLIKNYNKEISSLLKENKNLETDFAIVGNLSKVQERAKELSFEKTHNVKYIKILDTSLAKQ